MKPFASPAEGGRTASRDAWGSTPSAGHCGEPRGECRTGENQADPWGLTGSGREDWPSLFTHPGPGDSTTLTHSKHSVKVELLLPAPAAPTLHACLDHLLLQRTSPESLQVRYLPTLGF